MQASNPATDDIWTARIVAAALHRGAMIHQLSLAASMIAILVLICVAAGLFRLSLGIVWFAALLIVGAVEFWLAARVRFDADLFDALARSDGDLAGFDKAMLALDLMPASKAGRPMAARAQGAMRLLRWQAAALVAQCALLLIAALVVSARALT